MTPPRRESQLVLILCNGNRMYLLVSTALDLVVVQEERKELPRVDVQDTPMFRNQMKASETGEQCCSYQSVDRKELSH